MYVAKTMICHPDCPPYQPGQVVGICPPKLLRQFLKDGIVQQDGDPDEPLPGFEDATQDQFTGLTRLQLLQVIKQNKWPIQVMKSWNDEQIRTAIRAVADTGELTPAEDKPEEQEQV